MFQFYQIFSVFSFRARFFWFPKTGYFPYMDGKFPVHKNMNWKTNTNRRYLLNPANSRKKMCVDLKI